MGKLLSILANALLSVFCGILANVLTDKIIAPKIDRIAKRGKKEKSPNSTK